MRLALSCVALVALALGLTACANEEGRCTSISDGTAARLGIPVTFATEAPEEADYVVADGAGYTRFYYASRDGGLWILTADPAQLEEGVDLRPGEYGTAPLIFPNDGTDPTVGLIIPVNDQARTQSDIGTDYLDDLGGADPASEEARVALACADQDTSNPDL